MTKNNNFLLADDDLDDADLFREALLEIDATVKFDHVENGLQVFEYLKNPTRPDVIFLDLNMPMMSGWQCLSKLKNDEHYRDIPVIMYSTSSHYRDIKIAEDLGANAFITKPSDFNILKKIIEQIVRNPPENIKEIIRQFQLAQRL